MCILPACNLFIGVIFMKKSLILFATLFILVILNACNNATTDVDIKLIEKNGAEALEVIKANDYTYVRMRYEQSEFWVATGNSNIESGKTYFPVKSFAMENFKSTFLNKTFEKVIFAQELRSSKKTPSVEPTKQAVEPIVVEGTTTIAQLLENKAEYKDKWVSITGKVTKVNNGILQRNWIHIEDGSRFNGNGDLTVTTSEEFEVGDVVVLKGLVKLDLDFGAGYKYGIIVENAARVK